jgi:hypothetical protein
MVKTIAYILIFRLFDMKQEEITEVIKTNVVNILQTNGHTCASKCWTLAKEQIIKMQTAEMNCIRAVSE